MEFSEEFLRRLCDFKVTGDFPPFAAGRIKDVENRIEEIVAGISLDESLAIKADFDSYGSGFASYVDVKISKKEASPARIVRDGNKRIEWIEGLSIYISKLSPFWFAGATEWTNSYEDDRLRGGSGSFLRPESALEIDREFWGHELNNFRSAFDHFGYKLLPEEALSKPLWFDVTVPTILSDPPYRVFDCFFYWED